MVSRYRDLDLVIAELQRELTAAEKLLVLPARIVGVGDQAGKPLGQEIYISVVFREVILAAAATNDFLLDDIE